MKKNIVQYYSIYLIFHILYTIYIKIYQQKGKHRDESPQLSETTSPVRPEPVEASRLDLVESEESQNLNFESSKNFDANLKEDRTARINETFQ